MRRPFCALKRIRSIRWGKTLEEHDKNKIMFGHGPPTDPTNVLQHQTTIGEYKARNQRGGKNARRLAHMLICPRGAMLIYSTELARSLNLGRPTKLTIVDPAGDKVVNKADFSGVKIAASVTKAGDLNPTTVTKSMVGTYIVAGLVYGLVNVRTDGETILCNITLSPARLHHARDRSLRPG